MVKIRVPASSANLGPGFDSLGVALKVYNRMDFRFAKDFRVDDRVVNPKNPKNLCFYACMMAFERMGYKPEGVHMAMKSDIPVSRGLGSSAACILGGIQGAVELVREAYQQKKTHIKPMKRQTIFELATEIEGHPDNVAAQYFGGLTASIQGPDGKHYVHKVRLKKGISFCALIPAFNLTTKASRGVLPDMVSHKDAAHNVGRTAFLVTALVAGDWDNLHMAFEDRLHEPYRSELIPDYEAIKAAAYENGAIGFYLSGAGPTLMTIKRDKDTEYLPRMQAFLDTLDNKWEARILPIDHEGLRVNQ